jgi:multicomponent Na+:H+ antiporter subunit C
MEALLSGLIGLLFAAALYQMLSGHFLRFLLGLVMISNAATLSVFVAGRLTLGQSPLIPKGADAPLVEVANALPQALVLTAIVIGLGLFAFTLFLAIRAFRRLGHLNANSALPGLRPRKETHS